MLSSDRLRKVSDTVYLELSPSPGGSRPLEWRRRFNNVSLLLTNISLTSTYSIHDVLWDRNSDYDTFPWQAIKPKVKRNVFITALVDDDRFQDIIYYTVEEKSADEPLTKLQRAPGKTEVILRAGKPTEATDRWPSGLYYGACTLVDGTQKPAYWCFEVELPSEQFSDILESIRRDPTVQITVDVHLLSFVYEVDAALRDVDDPQDLFVDTGTTAAATISVSTSESFNQTDGIPLLPS